jgi:hypothetical protein
MRPKFYGDVKLYIVCDHPRIARVFADRNGFPLTEYKLISSAKDVDGIGAGFYIFINGHIPFGIWEMLVELYDDYLIQKIVVEYDFKFPRSAVVELINKAIVWFRDLWMYLKQIGRYNRYTKLFNLKK